MRVTKKIDWHDPNPSSYIIHITPVTTFYMGLERVTSAKSRWFGHKVWVSLYGFLLRNSTNIGSLFGVPKDNPTEIGIPLKI
eukprot:TRINITY_DN30656_c0_g1_i1.p1 TRINITY_DN30656_c0_g1~~TRINITY_DN30656_c0_g1_i1.p1  ORF type:complete len:82 (-),score=11.23 TRINITY_DN30656_c0_g1_i1:84-329(-)